VAKQRLRVRIDEREIELRGRLAWTMSELLDAGSRGITTLERPAPRWSHYVFMLRRKGICIASIPEKHGGEFAGMHSRYRLTSDVHVVYRVSA
jgi:hypothetical protein